MAANFCMNCGTRLEPGARVCSNCGEPVPQAHESVNPLRSGAIPAVGTAFEGPVQQPATSDMAADARTAGRSSESVSSATGATPQQADAAAQNAQFTVEPTSDPDPDFASESPELDPAAAEFAEERTQLIGMPPLSQQDAQSPAAQPQSAPSPEDIAREQFHEAEIKSGTWNESSPASYQAGGESPSDFTSEETRVIGWTESAPDGTCTVPFASQKPEAADLFEPPEADLSGFDVPAQPHYDLDDDAVASWGYANPESTFVASGATAASGWEDDRPAGYTGGLKQQATTQMPADVDPMAGVKRSDTMVMDPVTAQSVYSAPSNGATVYSSENTARRGNGTKVAAIVIAVVVVFAIIYLVQFNPYFLQNIQYDFSQWAQTQGVELLGGFAEGFSNIVNQIGELVR